MVSIYRNISKVAYKNFNLGFVSSAFISRNSSSVTNNKPQIIQNKRVPNIFFQELNGLTNSKTNSHSTLEFKRYYSKKKGKKSAQVEEESDSEEEEEYEESTQDDIGDSIITKPVSSLRLDGLLKVGLGLSKKKVDQEFYAFKLRVNGQTVTKKAMNVHVGDELDRIRGFSPDTSKFLIVDRIIIKGVGSITGSGNYPVKMEILKELTIENYEDPYDPSHLLEK